MDDSRPTPFRIEVDEGGRTIAISGEIDMATADEIVRAAIPIALSPGDLRLDLAGTTFLDASGLRALVWLAHQVKDHGSLVLMHTAPTVRRLLDLSGIAAEDCGIVVIEDV
jgi:anti-sigma B factor antagonist